MIMPTTIDVLDSLARIAGEWRGLATAWRSGNPFNGTVFAVVAAALLFETRGLEARSAALTQRSTLVDDTQCMHQHRCCHALNSERPDRFLLAFSGIGLPAAEDFLAHARQIPQSTPGRAHQHGTTHGRRLAAIVSLSTIRGIKTAWSRASVVSIVRRESKVGSHAIEHIDAQCD